MKLASGRELRFVDPRRFGRLSVAHGFEAAGSEPLEVQLDHFVSLFRGRKTPIKSALLNQKLLRGVGNIYADESLFRAGVRPRRRAASLTREDLRRLYPALQEVLQEAISLGGSSVSDYVDADGEEGFFQLQHRVYGREGEPCLVCKTPIKRVVIAGRSSHYCPQVSKVAPPSRARVAPPSRRLSWGRPAPTAGMPSDPVNLGATELPTSIIHNLQSAI